MELNSSDIEVPEQTQSIGKTPASAQITDTSASLAETPASIEPTEKPAADEEEQPAPSPASQSGVLVAPEDFSLDQLKHADIFARSALEHIFSGSVNARGVGSGYHYEGIPWAKGTVVAGSESEPDANGVYEARVVIDGVKKAGNGGFSSFFPKEWPPQDVVDAIAEAYEARTFVTGNTWRGSGKSISISMYLDGNDRILSAFPEYAMDASP